MMTQTAVEHFVLPLSACFAARPGQDFTAFAKQLIDDLNPYSAAVLDEAAVTLRRTHTASTWPPIAVCLEAVREAAHRNYVPPEKPAEPIRKTVPMPLLNLDPGGGFLTATEMRSCPVGTQYWAEDATIRYPNGAIETWGEFRRRRARERVSPSAERQANALELGM